MAVYITILLPLIAGAILPILPFKEKRQRNIYILAAAVATSLCVLYLMLFQKDTVYPVYSVFENMTVAFKVDGMSRVFMGLVAFLWPLASLYAFEYMEHEERETTFFTWYTMTYSVVLAIAMSANLFTFYIFYEALTLVTLPLVVHKQDAASNMAGRKYISYSISGAALGFIVMMFISQIAGTTDFVPGGVLAGCEKAQEMQTVLQWLFLAAFIGFATKAAVFPMHAWLPAASVAPTPVTALLHAVAVVNAGAFAVLRITYYTFGASFLYGSAPQQIALGLSCFTVVFASVLSVKEQHFKRRLAYSTISNLSYMLMGAMLMTKDGMTGSLTHMVTHSMMKIVLFYCAGAVLVKSGKEYVQDLRGFSRKMPFTCVVYTVAAVAMVGIPPLCGFVGKWNLLTASAQSEFAMGRLGVWALIISTVLTAIYLLSVSAGMYFRPLNAEHWGTNVEKCDPGLRMKVPLLVLLCVIVLLGMFSSPLVTFLRAVSESCAF